MSSDLSCMIEYSWLFLGRLDGGLVGAVKICREDGQNFLGGL